MPCVVKPSAIKSAIFSRIPKQQKMKTSNTYIYTHIAL